MSEEQKEWPEEKLYMLAQIDNMRKQAAKEVARARNQGETNIAGLILDAIDDFQRAISSLEQKGVRKKQALQGMNLALGNLLHRMAELGFQRIPSTGEQFDPARMEALANVPTNDVPEGTVVGCVKEGYEREGQLIRPSQVAVAVDPNKS